MRPAIDVLFQSAAATFGPRVAGVVLSGGLDDGSAGLAAIGARGGVTLVQSPEEATIDSMPLNAIATANPDHVAVAAKIAALLVGAVREPALDGAPTKRGGSAMAEAVGADDLDGQITGLTCPECHGSIWMRNGPGETTFSCRIGHSYSPESFFEMQSENVENALWAGVRSLEEQASLAQVMASRAMRRNEEARRERYEMRRRVATTNAEVLRRLLTERD